ncbi:c-type cytochrome [Sphingobium sp. KCTC 72723]|uniref:c-type cytochrome n=1 Tax=Sphingobium sp. KCTC 72723 TaxID=2733867 RepID=UPI00165DF436|nr:cytochrome c [Sphingobium sp. KCTC 72723]
MTIASAIRLPMLALLGLPFAALPMLTGQLTAAATPGPAPKAAIVARQIGYKKMGAAMKALNDQLKTDAPAKSIMAGAAQTLATTAREQPRLFPAGSGPTAGIATDALPNIWTERATFDAQMAKLITESGKLIAIVNQGNPDAIRVQAKATGATCAACHRQFRADT